ncbi:hypothetical protein H112_05845 [Trichophyton rubrum D6]|uniref:Uncharacterized protein n=3 Tax=Trichophyton TaxID=5550 RepID=A0A080WM97_TRIRC|nr:uncharacterized protein TERG_12015 [Trichophyton rubrum CBS 118892]EZF16004.1 hypothetical protein H100_05859 [Trichophyton rubrum MR850]EZF40133.1 hypothetical protein H102_05828 [Trichophyton rubrum CBS 100081]EZF50758.1 hypothetical protein H103_05856 [Trichophyton rubrum CBS 288.86]EZF61363.1 hypothetical protein H104_05842 [Trichophyton rubrum CBS 289.86]EZF72016.1 hypothetical protein H105_05869 [Trichophyton soudanense CBS 452.61]EZF82670.1 hypothetical protein H110_05850 [Trichophy
MVLAINSKQHCNANAASVPLGRGYVSSDVRTQHLAVAYGYISAEAEESQSNQLLSQHALRCSNEKREDVEDVVAITCFGLSPK